MKRITPSLWASAAALACSLSFGACDKVENAPQPPTEELPGGTSGLPGLPDPVNPSGTNDTPAVTNPYEQKRLMNAASEEMVNLVHSEDFQNLADLGKYFSEQVEDDNTDDVERWWKAAIKACTVSDGMNYCEMLYRASNFEGDFVREGYRWVFKGVTTPGQLTLTANDQNGKPCVAVIKPSGKSQVIHSSEFDDEERIYYGYYQSSYKLYKNRIEVPEHVQVSLTQGGQQLVQASVSTQLKVGSEEIDLDRDDVSAYATVDYGRYQVILNQAQLVHQKQASASATVKIDGRTVLTTLNTLDGNFSVNNETLRGVCTFDLNLLDQVQVRGTLTNLDELQGLMEELDRYDENETLFHNTLGRINQLCTANFYFNQSRNASGKVALESFSETGNRQVGWNYGPIYEPYTRYYTAPVMVMSDGSSFAFDNYFTESAFRNVIKLCEDLMKRFERMTDF